MRVRGMTRIIVNSIMIRATLDGSLGSNALVSAFNRSHIIVDKANDLFCLSSFYSHWFPNYYFSGGTAHEHSALKVSGYRSVSSRRTIFNLTRYTGHQAPCHQHATVQPGSGRLRLQGLSK